MVHAMLSLFVVAAAAAAVVAAAAASKTERHPFTSFAEWPPAPSLSWRLRFA
jgi:hypothetical protein